MAIEGLMVPQSEAETKLFKPGTPDVAEAVGVTLDLYKELGFAGDTDRATEDLTRNFTALTELGYDGHLFVPAPAAISFGGLRAVVEGKLPKGVAEAYTWAPFWTPGTEKKSVTEAELDTAPSEALARIALFNADTETGVDPVLHHLGMPVDDYARKQWGGVTTQEEAIIADKIVFGEKHADFELDGVDHRDYAVLAGMDRIRGVETVDPKGNDFILNRGWMRVPQLGRRTVGGGSVVGSVDSVGGRLRFGRGCGFADSDDGVGLSAGQKLKA